MHIQQVFDHKLSVYRCVNKYRGRQLDVAGLTKYLKVFISGRCKQHRPAMIIALQKRLKALKEVLYYI
jgi:hypothetical protein